ncbi:MAG: lipopolysaccharide biosynthesis protein [Acidobacteriota bacterium]|nr:lipopolysaccharide biosynthesis protein [Acidobacteriota bacterium]
MDNALRKRMTLGFLANWVSRLAGVAIQLIQVPVFLHFWSLPLYGEWLTINAIPAYLSFSSIGFGTVAGNEMTMLMGRDDKEGALRVFQSCWWMISMVCVGVVALLALVLFTVPVGSWHKFSALSDSDARWILLALGTAVLFGQLEQLLGAAYTCVGRYPYGTFVKSIISLCAFSTMIVPVVLGLGPRAAAISFGVANVLGTIIFGIIARHDVPWIEFGWRHARWLEIRRLTAPAFAFMAFPIGLALNLQGTVLAVSYALGPVEVVVFVTARTVSRAALQMVQLVNQTFWPELGAAFGAGNIDLVRTLHRRACQMAAIIAITLIAITMTIGPWALVHWTSHKLPPSSGLLFVLMISVFFYAGWSTSSTLLAAINRHQTLALYYVFGTGMTVVATYFAARYSGLLAAAASLILSELIMNMYVLPASLRVAQDTWSGFLGAMFEYPQALRPRNLLRRLRHLREMPGDHGEMEI